MRISTKGRYELMLMLELDGEPEGTPLSIKEIARRQSISDKYLEQIVSVLNTAGLVRSVRGPQGGYILRKTPQEITVGMILRLPVGCVEEDTPCEREAACVTVGLWRRLNQAINEVVDHTTLQDLLDDQKTGGSEPGSDG